MEQITPPMPPSVPNRPRGLLLAILGAWLALTVWNFAQNPPSDGILDQTRALSDVTHRQLATELEQIQADLKCEAWITATSFTPAGESLRHHAQSTRRAWSGPRLAVLMAFDRATNSTAMSFSPEFWERYSPAELVEIMQETRRIFSDKFLTLEERFALATRTWTDRLRTMETARLRQSLWFQRGEKPLALAAIIGLASAALAASVLGWLSRRRSACEVRRFHFPDVEVGMRFGAPFGGGVTAEVSTQVAQS